MSLFDARDEIAARLENGSSYGLTKATYGRLASAAMSASRYAGIEPSQIAALDGQPGVIVTLYGRHSAYEIRVEPTIQRISLSLCPLDSNDEAGVEIFSGLDKYSDWYRLVQMMLRLEDFHPMSREEAEAWLRKEGVG